MVFNGRFSSDNQRFKPRIWWTVTVNLNLQSKNFQSLTPNPLLGIDYNLRERYWTNHFVRLCLYLGVSRIDEYQRRDVKTHPTRTNGICVSEITDKTSVGFSYGTSYVTTMSSSSGTRNVWCTLPYSSGTRNPIHYILRMAPIRRHIVHVLSMNSLHDFWCYLTKGVMKGYPNKWISLFYQRSRTITFTKGFWRKCHQILSDKPKGKKWEKDVIRPKGHDKKYMSSRKEIRSKGPQTFYLVNGS